jgi:hypothetical protein
MALSSVLQPAALAHDRHGAGRRVGAPAPRTWLELLSRLGLVISGIIYFVPGVFALGWALGSHRQPLNQAGTIDWIGHQPLGRALLAVVAFGLAGYAIWGVIRTVNDPLRRGHTPAGIALSIGYATSAIAYLGLLIATVRLLTGGLARADRHQDLTLGLLARPFGGVMVFVIGLCWIFGSGIAQIVMGWRRSFERDLMLERMGLVERRWAIGLGRAGLISRGIVFTIIGMLLVAAALHLQPHPDAGLVGALLEMARQPFGRALLGAAGLGLMAFGTYSAMCARWMRMHRAPGDAESSSSPPRSS